MAIRSSYLKRTPLAVLHQKLHVALLKEINTKDKGNKHKTKSLAP